VVMYLYRVRMLMYRRMGGLVGLDLISNISRSIILCFLASRGMLCGTSVILQFYAHDIERVVRNW